MFTASISHIGIGSFKLSLKKIQRHWHDYNVSGFVLQLWNSFNWAYLTRQADYLLTSPEANEATLALALAPSGTNALPSTVKFKSSCANMQPIPIPSQFNRPSPNSFIYGGTNLCS